MTRARQSGSVRMQLRRDYPDGPAVVFADDDGPAQLGDVFQRVRVADAAEDDLGPAAGPHGFRRPPRRTGSSSWLVPCTTAVMSIALARRVGEHPRQVDRADLGDLVQAEPQRRVEPPGRGRCCRSARPPSAPRR